MSVWILPALIIVLAVLLSLPMGRYLAWILDGRYRGPRWLRWLEQRIDTGPQNWKQYAVAILLFSTMMFVFGYLVLALQSPDTPLNPDKKGALFPTTIFNTTASFLTNTNLQHYAGEQHLSYLSQIVFIVWNMFVSAAVGICALLAVIRGLRGDPHLGNFYLDLWRVVMYVLLPFSVLTALPLMALGVPMTFDAAADLGGTLEGGKQLIARGPVAAILPIKHLGTNGGGFFGANSTHPFENPDAWTNVLECLSILIFPLSLVVVFGIMVKRHRDAALLYGVMLILLCGMIAWAVCFDTLHPNPSLLAQPDRTDQVDGKDVPAPLPALPVDQNGFGNLEGKELRFGPSAGPTFAAVTTGIACGSVNCMHDSLTPLASLSPFTGMWLNCIFGGKGVGLVNFLVYLIVGVFLSGLMVGRTPEYLGKKVEAREMKLAMLSMLAHPILILGFSSWAVSQPWGVEATSNKGAHGMSQILYEFSSSSANNGSGEEGLADTWGTIGNEAASPWAPWWDLTTGLVMLFGRYLPIIAPIALAASMAAKKPTPFTAGTLRTDTITFGFVILGTILLVGALLFLPAAILGPVAEQFGPMPFGR
jgi:K+-transporting ATPase ATPase A chain